MRACVSFDDIQNIVKIMCDTAGQCTDAFHLLSLPKLLFELFMLLRLVAKSHIGKLQLDTSAP